jgi:hypothetical protein
LLRGNIAVISTIILGVFENPEGGKRCTSVGFKTRPSIGELFYGRNDFPGHLSALRRHDKNVSTS